MVRMHSWCDLLRESTLCLVALVISHTGAVWRQTWSLTDTEKPQLEPKRASLEMSQLFLAHVDWAELQRVVRQGRGGIKRLVDRAGGHHAFTLTLTGRVCVQNPGAPTLEEQPSEELEPKWPGLRLIWITFCSFVLTKLLNDRKCPQQYHSPNLHRQNVAFCVRVTEKNTSRPCRSVGDFN